MQWRRFLPLAKDRATRAGQNLGWRPSFFPRGFRNEKWTMLHPPSPSLASSQPAKVGANYWDPGAGAGVLGWKDEWTF